MATTTTRVAVVAALACAAIVTASAATLGGISSSSLKAMSSSGGSGAPTVIGCDNFIGTNNSNMNGRVVNVASACASRTWSVETGGWTIKSNQAAPNATADAVVTLNTAQTSATVQATLSGVGTNNRSGGVVLDHDGTNTYLTAVAVNTGTDRIDLKVVKAGTATTTATVNTSLTGSSTTLAMTRSGATVTVSVNDNVVLTETLTASEQSSLTGGRVGLIGGNSSVRFDDFLATSP